MSKEPEIFVGHLWQPPCDGHGWKCLLCGGLTNRLPTTPTPEGWVPAAFEPLTISEHADARRRRGKRLGRDGTIEDIKR